MKRKRTALLNSILALLLCVSMLVGSTFAWFTDEVNSTGNIIQSGTLEVELEYWDGSEWKTVQSASKLFGEDLWEPGYTEVLYLRVSNLGNLALKWQLAINILSEDPGTNKAGERFKLSDHIYMGVKEGVKPDDFADREAAVAAVKDASGIIGKGFSGFGEMDAGAAEQYLAVVVYMPTAVDNVANHNGVDDAAIDMGISLLATQKSAEMDSFGSDYDAAAKHPLGDINYSAAEPVKADDSGSLGEAVTVGNKGDEICAEVPAGVKLADGAEKLELTVQAMNESKANVTLNNGETAASLDVHMAGVAEDNSVPMLITIEGLFKTGLNSTSVAMYHVEDGVTVPMTLVANPVNHNEFSYDPATGDVVMCVATFSEYVAVTDNRNLWTGNFDYTWYEGKSSPYTISSADQLAGFGKIVDGTAEGIDAYDFKDNIVLLGADIDLSGGNSFNPIGCGYVNGVANSNGVEGRAFKGTFDGQNHTIFGLNQNGWDLGLSYCTLGGGLFASIAGTAESPAVVRNLTISGANVIMECVEQGVLVGLSQGTCTYDNIKIYNSKVANYQRATGGLIGEVSALNGGEEITTINNVVIGSDVVVGSLWGDFDAPVGGVIGARWDDANGTKVDMNNVTVAARLDVYNDVTSTYQWYAYRRAGMLIGNTDTPPANGKDSATATADFLTCTNVVVKYGSWVNYHYCQFTNHNSSWPWVRVEAGENCDAYSNPRYGVPNDPVTGQPVTSLEHNHTNGDEHYVELKFNQLYGGGQGIYGQPTHTGVTIENYDYTVTYMDRGKVFAIDYVNNDSAYTVKHTTYVPTRNESTFKVWVNAGGTKAADIAAGNTVNVTVYDSWHSVYTARFVDQHGNVIYEEEFNTSQTELYEPEVPDVGADFEGVWESYTLGESDITIHPVYTYKGNLGLTPVDEEPADGIVDYYRIDAVGALDANVKIPGYVNGIPVKVITDLASGLSGDVETIIIEDGVETINGQAFAWTPNLKKVSIPSSVTSVGSGAFANWIGSGLGGIFGYEKKPAITYDGTWEQWLKICETGWDSGLSKGSTVICDNGTYTKTGGVTSTGANAWAKQ